MSKELQNTNLPDGCIMTLKSVVDTINKARKEIGKTSFLEHGKAIKTILKLSETPSFGEVKPISTCIHLPNNGSKTIETIALNKNQVEIAKIILDTKNSGRSKSNILYLITNGEQVKIGVTNGDASKRLMSCQTGNHKKLWIDFEIKVDNAREIETLLHEKFKDKRLEGEWFELSKKDIKQIKNRLIRNKGWEE